MVSSQIRQISLTTDAMRSIAVAIPVAALLLQQPSRLTIAPLVFATVIAWQWIFNQRLFRARGSSSATGTLPGVDLWLTGLLFLFLLPTSAQWWQILLAVSFGVVLGEQIYGGRGHSFVSPVTAGLCFLFYSFQFSAPEQTGELSPWILCLPLALLLWYRLLDWRILAGVVIGSVTLYLILYGAPSSLSATLNGLQGALSSTLFFACVLFLACDPAIAPSNRAARWLCGFILGVLLVLFDPGFKLLAQAVYACILASIISPLVDWLCIEATLLSSKTNRQGADHAKS